MPYINALTTVVNKTAASIEVCCNIFENLLSAKGIPSHCLPINYAITFSTTA